MKGSPARAVSQARPLRFLTFPCFRQRSFDVALCCHPAPSKPTPCSRRQHGCVICPQYSEQSNYDRLNRNADLPEYNHLDRGAGANSSSVDYQAPAEYDHLNRSTAEGGGAYEVAQPDDAARSVAPQRLAGPFVLSFLSAHSLVQPRVFLLRACL